MWFFYLLIIAGSIMTFLRRDTALRTILAVALWLIARYLVNNVDLKIAFGVASMGIWFWAVFGYVYLSARNIPIRKYL